MGADEAPLDDKAKRMRDLLSSFYSPDPSMSSKSGNHSSKYTSPDDINSTSFDPDQYMILLVILIPNVSTFFVFVVEDEFKFENRMGNSISYACVHKLRRQEKRIWMDYSRGTLKWRLK